VDINEIEPLTTETQQSQSAVDQAGLGQEAFLRIFLAQLENQDPFDPQDSAALAAQLAQFSQLEQSVRMNGELTGINSRLDQLISSSGSQSGLTLDPVAMIGRLVELQGNTLQLPVSGTSEPLRIDLDRESELLGLVAEDPSGALIGLSIAQDDENPLTFPPGIYEFTFVEGEPRLKLPSGQELPLEMSALREGDNGQLEVDPNAGPVSFRAGTVYPFIASAIDQLGQPFEPQMTTTGTVDGVRIVNGLPVLSIAGQEIDPSQIIGIR